MSQPRIALLAVLLAACVVACAPERTPTVPKIIARYAIVDDLAHVGLAHADITPPIHLAMFGHGPEGRISVGFRLRLRCEVFVVAQGDERVALVPCDLPAPSLRLHHEVAARIAYLGVPIAADRIFLMATHTHAGPAHYFEARNYSGPFSSYAPGFDLAVVEFLGGRIADAVAKAYGSLQPSCLAWKHTDLPGLTFNRSYAAFQQNAPDDAAPAIREAFRQEVVSRSDDAGRGGEDGAAAQKAVDVSLDVLRVDTRQPGSSQCSERETRGAFAIFGMHPTGVPNTNLVYHGDIFGFAARVAEACLRVHDAKCATYPPLETPAVVGIANGIEGDVSPKVTFQSVAEAQRIGRRLGLAIVDAARDAGVGTAQADLKHAYRQLRFPGAAVGPSSRLASHGALGVAAAGGARDGPTRARVITEMNPGFRLPPDKKDPEQGSKIPLTAFLSDPEFDFPHYGPIAIVRIANGYVATAPGEMTTVTGQRIRRTLEDQLPPLREWPPRDPPPKLRDTGHSVALVGLTNSYLEYFATAEEYDLQLYEGASTLYGPHSSEFLREQFGCIARAFSTGSDGGCPGQPPLDTIPTIPYSPSPKVSRMTEMDDGATPSRVALKASSVWDSEGNFALETFIESLPPAAITHRGLFSVQVLDGSVVVDDDRGPNIEVRAVGDERFWRIRWLPPVECSAHDGHADLRCGKEFHFAIHGRIEATSSNVRMVCRPCPSTEGGP